VADSADKFAVARKSTAALSNLSTRQETELRIDQKAQRAIRSGIKKGRDGRHEEARDALMKDVRDPRMRRALELAGEKGASAVLTTLPLERHGFTFAAKRDYRDILRMRYLLPLDGLPGSCACGYPYTLDHSQICPKGGGVHWHAT
jgi:hypothetical protein